MDIEGKIARQGYNSAGAKRGRSGGSRRTRRDNKRGAKQKALRVMMVG